MSQENTSYFTETLKKIIEEDLMVAKLNRQFGVPRPIIRKLLSEFGSSASVIYAELSKLKQFEEQRKAKSN